MPWIITNWRLLAIGSAIFLIFYSGWHAHGWVYEAEKLAAVEAQKKADDARIMALNTLSEQAAQKEAENQKKIRELNQKWSKIRADKKTADCPIDAAALELLRH